MHEMRGISLGGQLESVTLKIHRNMLRIITDRFFRVIELSLRASVRNDDLPNFLKRSPFGKSIQRMIVGCCRRCGGLPMTTDETCQEVFSDAQRHSAELVLP